MPQPQPGADRPADGSTPDQHPDRGPAVSEEPTLSPVPPADRPRTGPEGTRELPTDQSGRDPEADGPTAAAPPASEPADDGPHDPDTPPADAADADPRDTDAPPADAGPQGTRRLPGDQAADAATPAPDAAPAPDAGPQSTRRLPADEPEAAPRWSGSAPVPPPPPRRRAWGESAEPTPVPPAPPEPPEHRVPVDPWAHADTGGWELPSAELPALPPTLPYPVPPPTRPYSGPPAPPPAFPAPAPPPAPVSPPPAARPGPPPAPVARPPAPVAPPPMAPVRPPRQRRGKTPPPVAPPPGWQAPKGYVPVAVRKRRRWPWLLLLSLACCCGCPAYYGMPMATQYPAHATLPAEVADLRLRDDNRAEATARQLETEVRKAHWLAEETFAGVYATGDGKRVTVFGGTGFRLTPEADAEEELARLTEQYQLGEAQVVETGVRGRHGRCAAGRDGGTDVVVCTSADHGSIATAVFTRLSVDDSARLLDTLRGQIVTAEQN
ncbi:hypothetical protein ACVCAH_23905 [Micromonospora sp. LZ34]